jgi:hypothetical protein
MVDRGEKIFPLSSLCRREILWRSNRNGTMEHATCKRGQQSHLQFSILRLSTLGSSVNLRVEKAGTLVDDGSYENVENTSPHFRHCEENPREWSVANVNVPDNDDDGGSGRRGNGEQEEN